MPGDTLAIHIQKIELPERGAIATGEGVGVLGDEVERHATKILPIRDGYIHFDDLKLPVSLMFGVIGVATRGEAVLFLQDRRGITFAEAAMLASLAVDIRISQLVDPYKTVKAFIPGESFADELF